MTKVGKLPRLIALTLIVALWGHNIELNVIMKKCFQPQEEVPVRGKPGGGGGAVFISLSPPGGGEDVAVLFILAAV